MKAFLSHSSANKNFVNSVYLSLGSANSEYDERTFSSGRFNTDAIRESLLRCQIFCLFATRESLSSGYVEYETALALEHFAQKKISIILTICDSKVAIDELPASLRSISAIRRAADPGACARIIRSELIDLDVKVNVSQKPFVGRDNVIREIKARLASPSEATPLAVAFSGVDGIGRRTLASKIISDVYPGVGKIPPTISIASGSHIPDLFRSILDVKGFLTKAEILQQISDFEELSQEDQYLNLVRQIRTINKSNDVIFLIDNGGLLDSDGRISSHIGKLLDLLKETGDLNGIPYFVFVLFRTPPISSRTRNGIYYFRVDPLEIEDIQQLVSLHIKRQGKTATPAEISTICELIDGHPYNLHFLLRLLDSYSIQSIANDPSDLVSFKKRQGDEFVSKIKLSDNHIQILRRLRVLGQSPVELIGASLDIDSDELGKSLRELEELHCIERIGNLCAINRPLRAAFERTARMRLTAEEVAKIQSSVIDIFKSYDSEESIRVELMSSAARAASYLSRDDIELRAFLTPSNSVLVARQLYDLRRFSDCARVCLSPLKSQKLISPAARLEAVRLRCLSFARLGEERGFNDTIAYLNDATVDEQAIRAFLEGFKHRLNGDPMQAVIKFKQSYALNSTSFSTLRELAHSLSSLGERKEAKSFAEMALTIAPTNPYVIDQVLALRIAERQWITTDTISDPEVSDLLDKLERYGDEEGKSFYAIRMADILRRAGDLGGALDYAQRACELTKSLVPAHSVEAEILIRMGKLGPAKAKLDIIHKMIMDKNTGEGKTRLPEYIILKANYLIENDEIDDAIDLVRNHERRLTRNVDDLKKKISMSISQRGISTSAANSTWLKAR